MEPGKKISHFIYFFAFHSTSTLVILILYTWCCGYMNLENIKNFECQHFVDEKMKRKENGALYCSVWWWKSTALKIFNWICCCCCRRRKFGWLFSQNKLYKYQPSTLDDIFYWITNSQKKIEPFQAELDSCAFFQNNGCIRKQFYKQFNIHSIESIMITFFSK